MERADQLSCTIAHCVADRPPGTVFAAAYSAIAGVRLAQERLGCRASLCGRGGAYDPAGILSLHARHWLFNRRPRAYIGLVEVFDTLSEPHLLLATPGQVDGAGHANLSIIRSQTGDFTRSKGKEVMEGFIKAEDGGKNICAVYAHNDDMAVGAIQAIKDAGLKPGTDILVVSIDAVPDIFSAMAAGEANATVELTPNMAGPAFDALQAFWDAGTAPEKFIITESKLYTQADDPQGEYDRRKGLGY